MKNEKLLIKMSDLHKKKIRLDVLLLNRGLAPSRHRAQAIIGAGKVFVNGKLCDKCGTKFSPDVSIELKEKDHPYVSRGGLKLEHALKEFNITVDDLVCIDVGASTGGFTDCLLRHGAKRVYAVDVGYGQLDISLRENDKVVVMERKNIRYISPDEIPEPCDLATIDTSFISLKLVIPSVIPLLKERGKIIALIKPQFEAGAKFLKKGVLRDENIRKKVVEDLCTFFTKELGLICKGVSPSPILGPKGNKEFLCYLKLNNK